MESPKTIKEIDWKKEFIRFSYEHEELLEAYVKAKKREIELLSIINQYETLIMEGAEI